jgi:hypothetical protein
MPSHIGHQLYLELGKETTWGTAVTWATVNPKHKVYGRGDGFFAVKQTPDSETMMTNVGHGRPFHHITGIKRVQGPFRTWAFPVTAQAMIEWGSLITANDLASYSARVDGGNQVLEYTGLKVAKMTLASGAEIGAQRLQIDYDLIGKTEATITTFTEDTYDVDDAYRHADGVLTVDGVADATVRDFRIEFNNTLDTGVGTGTAVQWIHLGGREVTAQLTIEYDNADLKTKFEAATNASLTMAYSHPKGAAFDLLLDLKTRCEVIDFTPTEPLRGRATAQYTFKAMLDANPNTGNDFVVTVS